MLSRSITSKFYLFFVIVALFFPFLAAGQTPPPPYTSNHFAVYLRTVELPYTTTADMARWLTHLDKSYVRLQELTSYTPFTGNAIEIQSVALPPNIGAYAGNPIAWNQDSVPYWLTKIGTDDDWCHPILHEISHDFDAPVWNFHAEVFGTFKTLYIVDNEPSFIPTNRRAELEQLFSNDFTGSVNAFSQDGIVRPSIEYWLIKIQKVIAADEIDDWQAFRNTFSYMLQNGNPSATGAEKFTTFMNALDSYTSVNIFNDYRIGLTTDQINQIKHFLDKEQLSKWDDGNEFAGNINLKAYKYPSGTYKLTWNDFLGNEDGYEIYYSMNGGTYQHLADTGTNTREYLTSNLSASEAYQFKIRAYNVSSHINYRGYSFFSQAVSPLEIDPDIISVYKPVTTDGMSGNLAVDGLDSTRCVMLGLEPHYVAVALQDLVAVDKFVIKHDTNADDITRDFTIQKSLDGQNWVNILTVTGNTQSISTHTLAQPVYASYFRLYITKATRTTTTTAQILEFSIYRSTSSGLLTNVALNKNVTADSFVANENPEKALDGNIDNNSKWCAMNGTTHFLRTDLGQNINLSYFVVKHAGLKEDPAYNTKEFTIKVSQTDTNWANIQPIVTVVNNTSPITCFSLATPVTARYVRLDVLQGTQTAETTARIFELEAWGQVPIAPAGGLTVYYENHEATTTANTIRPWFKIKNEGTSPLNLADVTLRYWYTREGSANQTAVCDYAGIGGTGITSYVNATCLPATPAVSGANYYLEISFANGVGSLAPGQSTDAIQIRFNKTDWSNYTQTDDYSFNSSMSSFSVNTKITGCIAGVLLFGNLPQ